MDNQFRSVMKSDNDTLSDNGNKELVSQSTDKVINTIWKIDQLYRSSPTVQALVSNAPVILQSFKELKYIQLENQARLEALKISSDNSIQKFRDSAPRILDELKETLNYIRGLQATVRQYAPLANSSEQARTIVTYTNNQIDQNISIFNSLIRTILTL